MKKLKGKIKEVKYYASNLLFALWRLKDETTKKENQDPDSETELGANLTNTVDQYLEEEFKHLVENNKIKK